MGIAFFTISILNHISGVSRLSLPQDCAAFVSLNSITRSKSILGPLYWSRVPEISPTLLHTSQINQHDVTEHFLNVALDQLF